MKQQIHGHYNAWSITDADGNELASGFDADGLLETVYLDVQMKQQLTITQMQTLQMIHYVSTHGTRMYGCFSM